MKKLFYALLAVLLCSPVSEVVAGNISGNVDAKKDLTSVKIYRINNPAEELLGKDKNTDLSVMFARGKRMHQYLILSTSSVKQEMDYLSAKFLVNRDGRLTFIDGRLYGDSLLVYRSAGKEEQVDIKTVNTSGEGEHSPALFSFRLADETGSGTFLIESWAKGFGGHEGEWIKVKDGSPVAVKTTYNNAIAGNADIFSYELNRSIATKDTNVMEQELGGNAVSISGDYGSLIIQGAGGKKVIVMNSNGTVIANETASSNAIKLPAPSGIVMVSIDGQPAMKTVVK